jgi:hypothetical protein
MPGKKLFTAAVAALGFGALAVPATASAKTLPLLTCTASVSNAHPADHTVVDVIVRAGAAGEKVTATLKYWSKKSVKTGVTTGKSPQDVLAFGTDDATLYYKVQVDVGVTWPGWRPGSCTTSFTPQA